MATLSAAQTIDGITNSYVVTCDSNDNLDTLVTACASIGMSRAGEVITFSPGTNRILAINGTFTEARAGVRTVRIAGSGHICWAYATGSVVTLGNKQASGFYSSFVNVIYETNALAVGGDVMTRTDAGRNLIGRGTFYGVAGGFALNHTSRSDYDISDFVTLASFDNWQSYMTTAGQSYSHAVKPGGKFLTTDKTGFIFIQRPMEAPANTTEVQPFNTDFGFRWLSGVAGTTVRVLRPTYPGVDAVNTSATSTIDIVDPINRYVGPCETGNNYPVFSGVKRILRTLKATFKTPLGQDISSPSPKLVTLVSGGSPVVTAFASGTASVELLQSVRASGVNHDSSGNGFVNQPNYNFWLVGYGYIANNLSVNIGTAYSNTLGVLWNASSAQNALAVSVPYASVSISPFSINYATNTITISASCTPSQVAQFLMKDAYDNAQNTYWLNKNHNPVTLLGLDIDFGNLNFLGINFIQNGTNDKYGIKSTGTLTANGAMSNLTVNGNVSQATPTNLLNVAITGNLTYNTNTATSITITNTTIGTVANSGTGIVTITPTNSSITTYTDAEINFLDSSIEVIGATSTTAYPTATDRNNDTNALATFTTKYPFKYGTPWVGTVYLKVDIGFVAYKDILILPWENVIDLGTTGLLASIQSNMALEATSQSIKTQTDKMSFTGTDIKATLDGEKVVVATNEDKLGYGLTTTERTAIANEVEAQIIDDTDSEKVLQAIVDKIGNTNVDEIALVSAIRSDLERTGGKLDLTAKTTELNSAVTSIKGVDNKDITQVFNNTPTIDNAGVATAVRTELTPELALIDTNLDKKVSEVWIGGIGYSLSGVTGSISNLGKLVREENDKLKEHIDKKNNETKSHIELAKSEINDTIEAIEIPEADVSTITTGIGTLKGQFTKLSEWIKKKEDKEKSEELSEKEEEYSSLLQSIEDEYKTIVSSKDSEIEALKKDLEEEKSKEDKYEAMVTVLEEEIQETKEKTEKETKENILKTLETL